MKTILGGLVSQLRTTRKLLLIIYVPLVVVFAVLAVQPYVSVPDLTRDTVFVNDTPIYVGIISDAGMYIWAAVVAICGLCAVILYKDDNHRKNVKFLTYGGLLTLFLLLDDRLLLHEEVIPKGQVIYVLYLGLMAYYIYRYRSIIMGTKYIYFGLALLVKYPFSEDKCLRRFERHKQQEAS